MQIREVRAKLLDEYGSGLGLQSYQRDGEVASSDSGRGHWSEEARIEVIQTTCEVTIMVRHNAAKSPARLPAEMASQSTPPSSASTARFRSTEIPLPKWTRRRSLPS